MNSLHPKIGSIVIPSICTLLIFSQVFFLWTYQKHKEQRAVQEIIKQQHALIELPINQSIKHSVIALRRMAQRWEVSNGTDKAAWSSDAKRYVKDNRALSLVAWVDQTAKIQWTESNLNGINSIKLNIIKNKSLQNALDSAARFRSIFLTSPLNIRLQFPAVIAIAPMYSNNRFLGYIIGVYNIADYLDKLISDQQKLSFNYLISDGTTVVYQHTDGLQMKSKLLHSENISIFNRTWNISITPTQAFISQNRSYLPTIILIGGLLVSLLTGLLIRFIFIIRQQKHLLKIKTNDLKRNKNMHYAMLNCIADGVIRTDSAGTIKSFNYASEKLFDHKQEEINGKNISTLLQPKLIFNNDEKMHDSSNHDSSNHDIKSMIGSTREFEAIQRDGNPKPIVLYAHEIRTGEEKYYIFIMQDLAEQNQLKLELTRTQDSINEANQIKSTLLINISKNIYTHTHEILKQNKLLENSFQSAQALLNLSNDISEFSRTQVGNLPLHYSNFNLLTLTSEIITSASHQCNKKGLELIFNYSPCIPDHLNGDAQRIKQILTKLLDYAITLTNRGYIGLSVEAKQLDINNVLIQFIIEDSDTSIPKNKHENVFELSAQENSSSGMELTLCKRLARLIGGDIRVEHIAQEGSRFTCSIPLGQCLESKPKTYKTLLNEKNILIISSQKLIISALSNELEQQSAKVTFADTAGLALVILEESRIANTHYHFIIVDSNLKDVPGDSLVTRIKDIELVYIPKIIKLANTRYDDSTNTPVQASYDGLINKPFFPGEITTLLCNINTQHNSNPKNKPQYNEPVYKKTNDFKIFSSNNLNQSSIQKRIRPAFKNTNILIVEDNHINQIVTQSIVKECQCDVVTADNGKIAVDTFKNQYFDIVLMDCHMPEMDGFMATKEIRAFEEQNKQSKTPIIALTANTMRGAKQKCLASGMDDYISKPVEPEDLECMLVKWISHKVHESLPTNNIPISNNDSDIFNLQLLNKLEILVGVKFVSMLENYLNTSSELVSNIQNAAQKRNQEQLVEATHQLKSSSKQIGATCFSKCVEVLERCAFNNDFDGVGKTLPDLLHKHEDVISFLETHIRSRVENLINEGNSLK